MIVHGLVLAGGRSRRFGADKTLALLAGTPLIAHVARILRPATSRLAVSGSRDGARLLNVELLEDATGTPAGPLSGVLTGLAWARDAGAHWLVTIPCDTPLVPADMPARLVVAAQKSGVAMARTMEGLHPLCAAWNVALHDSLASALAQGAHPPVHEFAAARNCEEVFFGESQLFLNINRPDDLRRAEAILASGPER